jgi:hypothetical protein
MDLMRILFITFVDVGVLKPIKSCVRPLGLLVLFEFGLFLQTK